MFVWLPFSYSIVSLPLIFFIPFIYCLYVDLVTLTFDLLCKLSYRYVVLRGYNISQSLKTVLQLWRIRTLQIHLE